MDEGVLSNLRHERPGESDEQLTDRARCGDQSAFGELYRRHRKAAESTASCLLRSKSDAEDVVSDAFTGVLSALRNGRGPRDNFRRYLLACVRNGCRKRRSRTVPLPDERLDRFAPDERLDRPASIAEDPERYVEADTVARAFASLAPRWQHTLWLTEVEQRPTHEVSEQMNLSPNATAALAHRARQAFAVAYLAEHVGAVAGTECMNTAPLLAGYVRGQLGAEPLLEVERHLVRCSACAKAASELRDVNATLRSMLPVAATAGAATITKATATTGSSISGASLGGASAGVSGGLLVKSLAAVLLISPAISGDSSAGARFDADPGSQVADVTFDDADAEPSPVPHVVTVITVSADGHEGRDGGATSVLPEQPAAFDQQSAPAVDTGAGEPSADGVLEADLLGPILGDAPIQPDKQIEPVVRETVTPLVTSSVTPILQIVQPATEPVVDRLDQALAVMGLGPMGESVRLLGILVPLFDEALVDLVVDGLLGPGSQGAAAAAGPPMPVPVVNPAAGDDVESQQSRPDDGPQSASAEPTDLARGAPIALPAVVAPSNGVPSHVAPAHGVPSVSLPANAGLVLGRPAVSIPPIAVPIIGIPEITLPAIAIPPLPSARAAS